MGQQTVIWDSTTVPDGTYAISAELVGGGADPDAAIDRFKSVPLVLIVDNVPGAVTGDQWLPAIGYMGTRSRWAESFAVDWVSSMETPLSPTAYQYPYEYLVAPTAQEDREALIGDDTFFAETWLQVWNARYDPEGRLSQTKEGHRFIVGYSEALSDEKDFPLRLPFTDGQYNQASLNRRTAFRPDPTGPGFIGISYEGRLFRLHPTEGITTLAGHVTRSDVVPYTPWDVPPWQGIGVTLEEYAQNQWDIVGNFNGENRFNSPNDLVVDPDNPGIIYVADTSNRVIRKVDLSGEEANITTFAGTIGTIGFQDGARGSALFHSPWSVEIVDGVLYVTDRGNNALRAIDLDTGVVVTIMDSAQLTTPMWIRRFSNGDLAIMDNGEFDKGGGRIKRLDPVAGTISDAIASSVRSYIFDVDWRGNVGPVDHIIAAGNYVRMDDHGISRITPDGDRSLVTQDWGLVTYQSDSGLANNGTTGAYAISVAVDDDECRIIQTGQYQWGVHVLRPVTANDPLQGDVDVGLSNRGRDNYYAGTIREFYPNNDRPSLAAVHGRKGHNYIGQLNFDDMVGWTDAQLAEYIRGGMGGQVARPELTGDDLAAMIYFIRLHSLEGKTQVIDAGQIAQNLHEAGFWDDLADETAPAIANVQVIEVDATTRRITFQTNEPTVAVVHYGRTTNYGLNSKIAEEYATTHSITLSHLDPEHADDTYFYIRVKDQAGNQAITVDARLGSPEGGESVPIAHAGGPYTAVEGGSVVLSGAGSTGTSLSYAWDLDGDGQYDDANVQNPTFRPQQDGVFIVGLRVTDGTGQTATATATVTVSNVAPTADAGGPYTIDVGGALSLDGSGSDPSLIDNAALGFSWDLNGDGTFGDATGATPIVSWSVLEGLGLSTGSYEITLRVSDDHTHTDSSATLTINPEEVWLGAIRNTSLPNRDPSAGDLAYRFETTRQGYLTIEALFDGAGGQAALTLYNAAGTPLATCTPVDGGRRIDWQVSAGVEYRLRLSGDNAKVHLRLTNLVQKSGDKVTVYGTDGDDRFDFAAAEYHQVTVNEVEYEFDSAEVAWVVFDGLGGDDKAVLMGTAAVDNARIWPTEADLKGSVGGSAYTARVANTETIILMGEGGDDTAALYDSPGDDVFEAAGPRAGGEPAYAHLYGSGFYGRAESFRYVTAVFDRGGWDRARLYDSPGDDTFFANPDYAILYGDGFWNRVKFADRVDAYANAGGTDLARLFGSAMDDAFTGLPEWAVLSCGTGVEHRAYGFGSVSVDASAGGNNLAKLYDSDGNDTFYAGPTSPLGTRLFGTTAAGRAYSHSVAGFPTVIAYATSGGRDVAHLYDSKASQDHFTGKVAYSRLEGPGFQNTAVGFAEVTGYASAGSGFADTASLVDSDGNDTFHGGPTSPVGTRLWGTTLAGQAFSYGVVGFRDVSAFAVNGGRDAAVLYDSAATSDTFTGTPTQSLMSGPGFSVRAKGFPTVTARASQNGRVDEAKLSGSPGDDVFAAGPLWSRLSAADGSFRIVAEGFSRVLASGGTDGYDKADLYGGAGNDTLVAKPTYAQLYGAGFFSQATGFDYVRAHSGGGNDFAAFHDDASGADDFRADAAAGYAKMTGAGFWNTAWGFSRIKAYATAGSGDTAMLDASPEATQRFHALSSGAYMDRVGGGYRVDVHGFDRVIANATPGGGDVAYLYDTAGDDALEALGKNAAILQNNGNLVEILARDFRWVYGYSTQGGTDTKRAAAVDFILRTEGPWVDV